MILARRGILRALFAAPAIVAAPSLMKVSALLFPETGIRINVLDELTDYEGSFSDLVQRTLRSRTDRLISNMERSNAILRMLRERNAPDGLEAILRT